MKPAACSTPKSASVKPKSAGIDIKVVFEQLGHSTILTRDTYQSVAKELHHKAPGAVAERIEAKRRNAA